MLTNLPPLPNSPAAASDAALTVRVVVKLSQRRVYLYRGDRAWAKYPIAIGKRGWETPTGSFRVLSKEKNPVFKSFRTGKLIYPGPNNPLGVRWIGIWTDGKTQLGFHGTNQEELLGQAVSHGCIRMRNQDVTAMFDQVHLGTTVVVEP
ncbi:MAG: L,D-transpeptidase [Tildeniella nuda ZEHNDER 1965/U140]|nr:L,D-transpeptidase [Tildeniella nuda ZEHNDER 1965/U140]